MAAILNHQLLDTCFHVDVTTQTAHIKHIPGPGYMVFSKYALTYKWNINLCYFPVVRRHLGFSISISFILTLNGKICHSYISRHRKSIFRHN